MRMRGESCGAVAAALLAVAACSGQTAGTTTPGPAMAAKPEVAAAAGGEPAPIVVPTQMSTSELPRVRVATDLHNPRGMYVESDGSMLVSVAGTGDPDHPNTGGLLHLTDRNQDGDFDDEGERATLLDQQRSVNILKIVRRDEVFGMAGIAQGDGALMTSLAFFGGPSTIFRIDGDHVEQWGQTHTNVNDLAYDERRKVWVAVASTTDEVLQLQPGGGTERIVKIPPLASGQDAVPAYLRYDPITTDLLVTLFSGSPEGEEGGKGTEIVPRSASLIRVHAEARSIEPVVTGLTVPTDLEIMPDGTIYVLEFCDAFLDPVTSRQAMQGAAMHGGFRRYSGRLLRVDRNARTVTVVATGLDAPTNLTRAGDALYVAEGMGTPGRLIPGPNGQAQPLTGFIERIALH